MKQYVITKLIWANDLSEVNDLVRGGETVSIQLKDEANKPMGGFNNNDDNR